MDQTEPSENQTQPPTSATSNRSVHTDTIVEVPEESSPTIANHDSPPPAPPDLPPPAVLNSVDLTTAVSPLDLTFPGLPAVLPQSNPHAISRILNPAGEESTEYFTANSGEGDSGNLSEQNLQAASRVQISNHIGNGRVSMSLGSYLNNNPNAMMVPDLTNSTTIDDTSSSGFSVASYSSHFSPLEEESESPSAGIGQEQSSSDESLGSFASHNSLIDESHSPPQPRTEGQFREDFNPRGSVRNQVERVVTVRFNPPDAFLENMENRLLRYHPSITTTNNEDALSGNHAFQSPALPTQPVVQPNINIVQQQRPVSRRLAEEITDRNRRSSFTAEPFIANIPAPFRNRANTLPSIPAEASSSTHTEGIVESFGSSVNSFQISNGSPIGSSLKRKRANSTEEEDEEVVVVNNNNNDDAENNPTDTDNQSTLVVSKEMSTMPRNGHISAVQPHYSLNPSPTDGPSSHSNGREPDTAELLRNWELSNSTRTTTTITHSFEIRGRTRERSSSNLLPPSPERNANVPTHENTVQSQTQVGGFQRSPIARTEPQTTSATQLEAEELRKAQGQVPNGNGNDNNSNWFVTLWRSIIAPFGC